MTTNEKKVFHPTSVSYTHLSKQEKGEEYEPSVSIDLLRFRWNLIK